MPWCPNCKSEYEAHVTRCKQCDVELVDDLSQVVRYSKLVELYNDEIDGALEYLNYLGITDVKTEVSGDHIDLSVRDSELKTALKHIKVYISDIENKKEEKLEAEESLPKEYETEQIDDDSKIKEMHSSAITFLGMGAVLTIFSLLNLTNILTITNSIVYLAAILVIGILFCIIGFITLKKIPTYKSEYEKKANQIEIMTNWYEENNDIKSFFETEQISTENQDEGALYFVAIDIIKSRLKGQFINVDELLINNAAEEIYTKINEVNND